MDELLVFKENSKELPAKYADRIIDKDDDWYYNDPYHVTNSMLSELEKSPLHLKYYLDNLGVEQEQKDHNIEGQAFHCAILEPQYFDKRFFVFDDSNKIIEIGGAKPRGTKAYKEWKAQELQKAEGKAVLNMDMYNSLMRMRDRCHKIEEIRNLIKHTDKEIIYHDVTESGVKRKCKFDAIRHGDYFFDLKSTKDPVGKFGKAFHNFKYDRQMAFYKDIGRVEGCFVIAVEKVYPFSIKIFEVTPDTLDRGRDAYYHLLKQYEADFVRGGIKNFDSYYSRGYI